MVHFRSAIIPIVFAGLSLFLNPAQCHAQAAPALSQLQVEFASSGYPYWDIVPVGGVASTMNHSGPTLLVGVLETGYAIPSSRIAKFNGVPMTYIRSDPQVNSYTRQVWGYLNYYRFDGNWTSGSFTYQSSSINYPWKTLSLRVNVR